MDLYEILMLGAAGTAVIGLVATLENQRINLTNKIKNMYIPLKVKLQEIQDFPQTDKYQELQRAIDRLEQNRFSKKETKQILNTYKKYC